ncbi:hypothetical protein [Antarcticirhabdus aurantiaca]|uniref:hypothetical protein n=1 Tax=Antarcticirhabdus aurantiaca TaxID=2606717 RepID=UPI00131E5854|nr:hypothetical protein [Antarcticirhabdus aurantiaca]
MPAETFEETRRRIEERRQLFERVDAIPADQIVNFEISKGDLALLIRSQSEFFEAVEELSDVLRRELGSRSRVGMSAMHISRARFDFERATDGILRKLVESLDGEE